MSIKLHLNRIGNIELRGFAGDFAKYERDIVSGKIPCPFKVEFLDTLWGKPKRVGSNCLGGPVLHWPIDRIGAITQNHPVLLAPTGKPKIPLF